MTKNFTVPQFQKALARLGNAARGNALVKSARAGGLVIEAQGKINVVKTFKNVTGNLAGSIQTTVESATPNRAIVAVGPTAIYGRIQELGGTIKPLTKERLHWVDENGKHHSALSVTLPPRPYMAPAANDHENEILSAITENLNIEIEKAL